MSRDARSAPPAASAATALDPDLFHSRSVLIYVRSSLVLSLLLYSFLLALLYSDLYVHLIRRARDAFQEFQVLPGVVLLVPVAGATALAFRMKPALERAALGILALNFANLYLRRRMEGHSDMYLGLCLLSLALDLALFATVIAFYRKYPNVLTLLRQKAGD